MQAVRTSIEPVPEPLLPETTAELLDRLSPREREVLLAWPPWD